MLNYTDNLVTEDLYKFVDNVTRYAVGMGDVI